MPHTALKLIPGVDQNRTPALNEAAISESNLVRFIPDRQGLGLVQKLGGWTKFNPDPVGSRVRCLWAWEDTNTNSYLAAGAETSLSYYLNGNRVTITPRGQTVNTTVDFSTTAGSSTVTVTDVGRNANDYDDVWIQTPIAVGGLVLFGLYQCQNPASSANTYQITAVDALGTPLAATSTVTNGGTIANFSTTNGSAVVNVNLINHGYEVGYTFPILFTDTVGGIPLYGNYIVTNVVDANNFEFIARNTATSTVSNQDMNGGDVRFVYYYGVGPLPFGTGFGVGGFGRGGFGTGIAPPTGKGTAITAVDWTLDNWGQILIANPLGGGIYEWNPITGYDTASLISEAPPVNDGALVAMPQRQIIAWGSTFEGIQDPLLIRWSDVNDYQTWIATTTNQAGSYRIPRGSRIVQCIQGPQQTLIWTDVGVYAMQYVGPPYVYQFNEIGIGVGLIGRKAAASMNGIVYWMGPSQFLRLGGNGVETIPCPIWDVIFQDLDLDNVDKIRVAPNSRFGEIAWYYPTLSNGGEVSHYVKYNINLNQWDYGELCRTAWINESVLGPPIGAGTPLGTTTPNYIYQHETSQNADGNPMPSSFQTGYFVIAEADLKMFVDQVWPDMKWGYFNGTDSAQLHLTFYVADYPGDTPRAYGPYAMSKNTQFITPRFRGRLVSIKIDSTDVDSFWRIGNMRYRFQPDGKF